MNAYENYNVFGHLVQIEMENGPEEQMKSKDGFYCKIYVDGRPPYENYCEFDNEEKFRPEKALISLIQDALDYENNDNLGDFIKNLGYDKSSEEINMGQVVFLSAQQANYFLHTHFTPDEVEALYKAIEKHLGDIEEDEDLGR